MKEISLAGVCVLFYSELIQISTKDPNNLWGPWPLLLLLFNFHDNNNIFIISCLHASFCSKWFICRINITKQTFTILLVHMRTHTHTQTLQYKYEGKEQGIIIISAAIKNINFSFSSIVFYNNASNHKHKRTCFSTIHRLTIRYDFMRVGKFLERNESLSCGGNLAL